MFGKLFCNLCVFFYVLYVFYMFVALASLICICVEYKIYRICILRLSIFNSLLYVIYGYLLFYNICCQMLFMLSDQTRDGSKVKP